jgi:magnesium-transporting ATPase (P-type)
MSAYFLIYEIRRRQQYNLTAAFLFDFPILTLPFQAIREQFRRNGNIYFLCIGILMFIGYYTQIFNSSITPWTTLGPLALVISVSLCQEGYTDVQRHRSDKMTNYHPCVVLRRAEMLDNQSDRKKKRIRDSRVNEGKDLKIRVAGNEIPIAFESVFRRNIRAGDLVFVRNRDMIPADLILLASSNEGGNAYIETSSIDGETNLKLRNSPQIPIDPTNGMPPSNDELDGTGADDSSSSHGAESLKQAVKRVASMSLLGHPDGVCALANPANADDRPNLDPPSVKRTPKGTFTAIQQYLFGSDAKKVSERRRSVPAGGEHITYIATLTSEPPNTHVNNYSGKLTFPPAKVGDRSVHAPLNAENILLRGAILRNTEWVIGLACFTGADTKLVMNSVATPSKFSQLDTLINRTVFLILFIMLVCVCSLGAVSSYTNKQAFDQLWYSGYNSDMSEPWPYFNLEGSANIESPPWEAETPNFIQNTFMFITMLSNFVPLSLYVSVEIITLMMMLYVGKDLQMYHAESDTPAAARSSIVTDLGLVEYIFSDKTGTLTCNVMEFKRCSVDGHIFGMPIAKAAPQLDSTPNQLNSDSIHFSDSVHPLNNLISGSGPTASLTQIAESQEADTSSPGARKLTFNAEMFLRVMSICHTVVVEKDHVPECEQSASKVVDKKKKPLRKGSSSSASESSESIPSPKAKKTKKKKDGAPVGYAYQAESPDEGALVAAASNEFGFQLLGRNSSGVKLSCSSPTLLEDSDVIEGFKNGTLNAKLLAAKTASSSKYSGKQAKTFERDTGARIETWPILAVNKFDSDRKRMSVLVRSPPELGSVPMLLCKGADSSMLLEGVCEGVKMLDSIVEKNDDGPKAEPKSAADNSELDSLLGIQAHLGGKFDLVVHWLLVSVNTCALIFDLHE